MHSNHDYSSDYNSTSKIYNCCIPTHNTLNIDADGLEDHTG